MLPHKSIEQRLQQAVLSVLPDADTSSVLIRPCRDPKFGDYQSNALMSLAKARKTSLRQLASDVVSKLRVSDICNKVEISGAGFLNFRLKHSALAETLQAAARGEHLFFDKAPQPRTIVIDFSSPNVAKPMHVGHIRSTILGDSLARTFRLLGHRVVTDNHIGDWGTQFGMLFYGFKFGVSTPEALKSHRNPIELMVQVYRDVNYMAENETTVGSVIAQARTELVKLQSGDEENLRLWQEMIRLSRAQFDEIYSRLGVKFDQTLGESFYNPQLKPLVEELLTKGIARESEGAIAIFFEDIPQLKEQPAIIRKSDGGFNYTTTDLATLAYRFETWHPNEIIYVTDGRQQLHFQQVFATFRRWLKRKFDPDVIKDLPVQQRRTLTTQMLLAENLKLVHVWFGSILGEEGKPLKTRSGENVKLSDLLDEAEERALQVVSEKSPGLPESERREIARVIGISAVKYADLLPNRQSDYVFSWDKMLALNGNTAPYLQYAYARIRSIFRKGDVAPSARNPEEGRRPNGALRPQPSTLNLSAPEEIALARHLLNFGLTLEAVADEYRPNFLCNYLYELAGRFTQFYEHCPVLKSEGGTRASRLAICQLTAKVLKQGLNVLGIETLEQM